MNPCHILNGDVLAGQLKNSNIYGTFIICRECLMDGDVGYNELDNFWNKRAAFISSDYDVSEEEYFEKTVGEFGKMMQLPDHSEICLWFENDLFCQVNMWFVISLLSMNPTMNLFRVFPVLENPADQWKGFGISTSVQLETAFYNRVPFSRKDVQLGCDLWKAFQQSDFEKLMVLSVNQSDCFQFLDEVCRAHVERFSANDLPGRPEQSMIRIIEGGTAGFDKVYSEFSKQEGIYGFSDLQVRKIYDALIRNENLPLP